MVRRVALDTFSIKDYDRRRSDLDRPLLSFPVDLFRREQARLSDFLCFACFAQGSEEAGAIALVASGPDLLDLDQEGVAVAIVGDILDGLRIPLLSPFIQNFCRDRLQKWVLPVSIVFWSEAWFIQAIIRTRPLAWSWTMAGISPS